MNDYQIKGDYAEVYIGHEDELSIVLVDLPDLNRMIEFGRKWFINCNTRSRNTKYVSTIKMVNRKRTKYYLHRFIMDPPRNMKIDHINGNALDNRRVNLRIVTQKENSHNLNFLFATNTSGFHGVDWYKAANKWRARLRVDDKELHLGLFDNIEDAKNSVIYGRAKYMTTSKEAREGTSIEYKRPENSHTLKSKSGVKGVIWDKRQNKWGARFMYKRITHYVGYFNTVEEAASAVKEARAQHIK